MRRLRRFGLTTIIVLLVLAVIAAIFMGPRLLPAYQDAKAAQDNLNLTEFTYQIDVELNREGLPDGVKEVLDTLAGLTGLEQEAMYHLNIQGAVDGDILHAVIYPQGQSEPLTELYLSKDRDVVNLAMLYNRVYGNYATENPLLANFMPVWNDHEFVTLEQLEQMLEVDLKALKRFELPNLNRRFSLKEIFVVLALIGKEKDGAECDYALQWEGLSLGLTLEDNARKITAELEAEKPTELLNVLSENLSRFDISFNGEKLIFMDNISVRAVFEGGKALQIPTDLVSQNTVETITGLRDVIEELSGK